MKYQNMNTRCILKLPAHTHTRTDAHTYTHSPPAETVMSNKGITRPLPCPPPDGKQFIFQCSPKREVISECNPSRPGGVGGGGGAQSHDAAGNPPPPPPHPLTLSDKTRWDERFWQLNGAARKQLCSCSTFPLFGEAESVPPVKDTFALKT